MPASKQWKSLKGEVGTLRKHFLPKKFNSLGVYRNPIRVQTHTKAFLVLSHAEIESFLEIWAKDIARAAENAWTSVGQMTKPFTFLVATHAERIGVPDTISGQKATDAPQRLAAAVVKAFEKFYKEIKDNNGIKEKNVLKLLSPLGVPGSALGSTLLPNLDSFGASRGVHAHNSAKAVTDVLDPETEYNRVIALVKELAILDQWLCIYRKKIR